MTDPVRDLERLDVTPYFKEKALKRPAGAVKRAFRQRAGKKRWEQIRAAKLGPCRVCVWAADNDPSLIETVQRPVTLHHLASRSLGGDDRNDNLVPLCGSGTTGHHGLIEARHAATRRALALSLTDSEYAYLCTKFGEGFLERRYGVRYETIGGKAA